MITVTHNVGEEHTFKPEDRLWAQVLEHIKDLMTNPNIRKEINFRSIVIHLPSEKGTLRSDMCEYDITVDLMRALLYSLGLTKESPITQVILRNGEIRM